ncbi:hypothetical protein [Pseudomonas sp. Irchel 3A7]|jgi:hypothetical protein|uniref:hypothetical protein n=1 Tax=Pseudomonas sp. Irchel 3A7 TaxID=2008913 RepID=UPI000BA3F819|nr:hypothetical protein [Pseudomonas sp. Irchel 3A7]
MSKPDDESKPPKRLSFVIPHRAYWDYKLEAVRLDMSMTDYFLSVWAAAGIGDKCLCDWTYSVTDNNGEKLVLLVDLMTGRLNLTADITYVFRDLCDKMNVDDQTFIVFRKTDGRYAQIEFGEKGFVQYMDLGDVSFEEITRMFFHRAELSAHPMAQSDPS